MSQEIMMKQEELEESIDKSRISDHSQNISNNNKIIHNYNNNNLTIDSKLLAQLIPAKFTKKHSISSLEKPEKNKKIKKSTSLQGRPAKANEELRKLEDQIKSAAWRMAELEENLYLMFGGAKVVFDESHLAHGKELINNLYPANVAALWDKMVLNWKQTMNNLFDPLGREFVPVSDKFFLNEFKEHGEIGNFVRLDVVFLVYTFQMFLRTDKEGFIRVAEMMQKITTVVEPQDSGIFNIIEAFLPDLIKEKIPDLDDHMNVVYRLFYKVLEDTFKQPQKGQNPLVIVKNSFA